MIFAGRWQDRRGPKVVGITGGILLGLGYLFASWIGTSLLALYFAYGILGGLGVGFAYVTPIEVRDSDWLRGWIEDPTRVLSTARMPALNSALPDRARIVDEILAYLEAMRGAS